MNVLVKLERLIHRAFKQLPNLPQAARKWLGDNVWWLVLGLVILSALSILFQVISVLSNIALLANPVWNYYASTTSVIAWAIVVNLVSIAFVALIALLMAVAIAPLKAKQKKGWVLLFASLLVNALWVVTGAVLSLSVFTFIVTIVFGALWIAVAGYFLFEIHGEFAHLERSKGVKKEAKTA